MVEDLGNAPSGLILQGSAVLLYIPHIGTPCGYRSRLLQLERLGTSPEVTVYEMVRIVGFEPTTSCSQSKRSTKLS